MHERKCTYRRACDSSFVNDRAEREDFLTSFLNCHVLRLLLLQPLLCQLSFHERTLRVQSAVRSSSRPTPPPQPPTCESATDRRLPATPEPSLCLHLVIHLTCKLQQLTPAFKAHRQILQPLAVCQHPSCACHSSWRLRKLQDRISCIAADWHQRACLSPRRAPSWFPCSAGEECSQACVTLPACPSPPGV